MAPKSLSTLYVVINGRNLDFFWGKFLRKCLEDCTLLAKLYFTSNNYAEHQCKPYDDSCEFDISYSENSGEMLVRCIEGLDSGLARTTSLKELNITINNISPAHPAWNYDFTNGLAVNESITSLTVTISDYEYWSCEEWVRSLKRSLAKNKSLTTFTLTVNDYSEGERPKGELYGLAPNRFPENTSLSELILTVNIRSEVSEDWLPDFCDLLMTNCSSLRTVRLEVNNRCATRKSRIYDLSKLQLKYRSLSTFALSVTFYGE